MEQLKRREEYSMSLHNWSLICSAFLLLFVAVFAAAQTPLSSEQRPPVNVAGHWVIEAKNWNGVLNTKTVDLEQNGNSITGHFKGAESIRWTRRQRKRPPYRLPHQDQASADISWTSRRRHNDRHLSPHGEGRRISRRENGLQVNESLSRSD